MSKLLWIVLFLAVTVLLVGVFLAEKVPPKALTRTSLILTERRIRTYADEHHRLPGSLSDLPSPERDRDNSLLDGWGRPIRYTCQGHTATLLSLGRDGRAGGLGQDADIETRFAVPVAASQSATQE